MEKKYTDPKIEVVEVVEDVITTSLEGVDEPPFIPGTGRPQKPTVNADFE